MIIAPGFGIRVTIGKGLGLIGKRSCFPDNRGPVRSQSVRSLPKGAKQAAACFAPTCLNT